MAAGAAGAGVTETAIQVGQEALGGQVDPGDIAAATVRSGADPGAPHELLAYERARRADIGTRSFAVDLLNRSLISNVLPVQALRGLGLFALGSFGPLRRRLMREGIGATGNLPSLMREPQGADRQNSPPSTRPEDAHMRQYAG